MKKLLFSLALLATTSFVNAQEFKQMEGEKNLELQFTPLGGTPLGISGLRFRYFTSNTMAIRANVFVGYNNTSTITQDANTTNGANDKELKNSESSFTFNLRPGFESHFEGTDRLSPYVGAELDLNFKRTSSVSQSQPDNDIVETTSTNKEGAFRFGLNGLAGFDYYFAKHLYFGAELGLGLSYTSPFTTVTKSGSVSVESNENKDAIFNFGPIVNSAIRLGFLF